MARWQFANRAQPSFKENLILFDNVPIYAVVGMVTAAIGTVAAIAALFTNREKEV